MSALRLILVGSLLALPMSAGAALQVNLLPASIDFGDVPIEVRSGPIVVTITNLGPGNISGWSGGGVSAPFSASQSCGGKTLTPGQTCTFQYAFDANALGPFSATSSVGFSISTGGTGSFQIPLRGTSVLDAAVRLSLPGVDFGPVPIGTTVSQSVTLTNIGPGPIEGFAGGGVSPPFGASQNCAGAVPFVFGESCQFFYSFAPQQPGVVSADSSIGGGGGFTIALDGEGALTPHATAVPSTVDFGEVPLGVRAGPIPVTLTNRSVSAITGFAGGGVAPPWSGYQDCQSAVPLAQGESCTFSYFFEPTSAGAATLPTGFGFSSASGGGSVSIELRGVGVAQAAVRRSLERLDFGEVPAGLTVGPYEIELWNVGPGPIESLAGGASSDPQFTVTQNCVGALPLDFLESCSYFVSFTPDAEGRVSATSKTFVNGLSSFTIPLRAPEPSGAATTLGALGALSRSRRWWAGAG